MTGNNVPPLFAYGASVRRELEQFVVDLLRLDAQRLDVHVLDLARAVIEPAIAALQTEYSLWTRDPEAELLPLLRELVADGLLV